MKKKNEYERKWNPVNRHWIYVWEFYQEDGSYRFKVEANNPFDAYDKAYEFYGPQVQCMLYKMRKNEDTKV